MKAFKDAICANCEWQGDSLGLSQCPVCGGELSSLDGNPDLEKESDEKYPTETLSKVNDEELQEIDENLS